MDIFVPIGLGVIINALVFVISKGLKQTNKRAVTYSFCAFFMTLVSSFFIGRWIGMGMLIISSGMLLFTLISWVVVTIQSKRNTSLS